MEPKIDILWRQFEANMEGRLSQNTMQTFRAVFYAGAFACAWRISKHLTARGKNDQWLDELMVELDYVIRQQAAAEFTEPVQ